MCRRGDANSYSGRQNNQSQSGGIISGKNFEPHSKNAFDEKHVAHLLHQVFDDDDSVSGDDRNQQRAVNEESDFGLEADYRVSTSKMLGGRRILVEASSDDSYNKQTSKMQRKTATTEPCVSDSPHERTGPDLYGKHLSVRKPLTDANDRQSDDKRSSNYPYDLQIAEIEDLQGDERVRTASFEDWHALGHGDRPLMHTA